MERTRSDYPARYEVDYPERLNRLSTLLRIPFSIPIWIITALMPTGQVVSTSVTTPAFFLPLALMLLFRRKYPRWWFDFLVELSRFQARVSAYLDLLTDAYPATDETQSVHLEFDYPDAEQLNRFLPIVKWLLLLPHYIVLAILLVLAVVAIVISWFAILFTGQYPRQLFDFVVGVNRYGFRVSAYGWMLITDRYPPFSLSP